MPVAIFTHVSPLIYGTELRIRDDILSHETLVIVKDVAQTLRGGSLERRC